MSVLDENVAIFKYFEEISKIPHGSFHEEKIADYVENFAKEHNFKYVRDDMNNVIIYKNATPGYKEHDTVMLQAHMDMVCEKNKDVDFDFETDALNLYVEDGWLKAKGTTLGADDGFGVSYMLAILSDDTLKHPNLECVFTVQEEVGLLGSINLKKEYFNAKKMIGLDGGGEISTCTTTSGGRYAYVDKTCAFEEVNKPTYKLTVKGLDGGHSGACIDQEKGNSIKILFRVLQTLKDIQIVSVNGGLKENAIPREAEATFVSDIKPNIEQITADLKTEFEFSDSKLDIQLEETDKATKAFTLKDTNELITLYYLLPNGLQHKSMAIEGLTLASLNLGKLRTEDNVVKPLNKREEQIAWNKWRSDIQNEIMMQSQVDGSLGTFFYFSFKVDKYRHISNIKVFCSNPLYLKEASEKITAVIENLEYSQLLEFPKGSERESTTVKGMFGIGLETTLSNPGDFNDFERVNVYE